MTGRNVNLHAGSWALGSTADRGGGGGRSGDEAEVEVEISSNEVRANDHAQPNISLSLSPSAKSGREEARDRASDVGLVLGPKRLVMQNLNIALETSRHFREICVATLLRSRKMVGSNYSHLTRTWRPSR